MLFIMKEKFFFTVLVLLFVLTTIFGQSLRAFETEPTGNFRASVVKVDITPDSPKWLLGYGARQSTGIRDRHADFDRRRSKASRIRSVAGGRMGWCFIRAIVWRSGTGAGLFSPWAGSQTAADGQDREAPRVGGS